MFPDGNFCCPAKGVLDVLLCAQTKCLQGYEGAGKGKEDGAGVLVIVTGFPTVCSFPWPPQPRLRDVVFSCGSREMFVRVGGEGGSKCRIRLIKNT